MRPVQIYDSRTQAKQRLQPQHDNHVGMYVCGVTVYDRCHLGHARTYVAFDTVYRYLLAAGYDVIYVRNITDVDDKILQRAQQSHVHPTQLTDNMIAHMHADFSRLHILPVTHEPRATQYIQAMCDCIAVLLERKIAYLADNGDVYFHVLSDPQYGSLSHQSLGNLQAGARVAVEAHKRHPLDFVLWKRASAEADLVWPSPWGPGRPGWHIECSAMSASHLGTRFDIHGGGRDLLFPHHENERAQSECAHGVHPFVQHWMHTGYLTVDETKMSKSLGNFVTIEAACTLYAPEVLRLFLLSSHYRSPVHYAPRFLAHAQQQVWKMYRTLADCAEGELPHDLARLQGIEHIENVANRVPMAYRSEASRIVTAFHEAMQDDFNTPVALAVLWDALKLLQGFKQEQASPHLLQDWAGLVRDLGLVLGILQQDPQQTLVQLAANRQGEETPVAIPDRETIERAIADRELARSEKRWKDADTIRDHLCDCGIVLEDTPSGTQWHVKPRV